MGASALGQMRQVTYPAAQHPTSQQEIVALMGIEPSAPTQTWSISLAADFLAILARHGVREEFELSSRQRRRRRYKACH